MSSINTNNGAMIALQTLQSVNKNLGEVQGQISTGLKVGSAKDNAAVFAISQVMKSDVGGFKAVSDSLSLGASTLSVASAATDSIGDTLNEIKTKIVSAQESNVDRDKLQNEIDSLVEQVSSVVGAAQFNGLNLLDGSAGTSLDILSSIDRDGNGNVTTSDITIDLSNTNLSSTSGSAVGAAFTGTDGENTAGDSFSSAVDPSGSLDVTFGATVPAAGSEYSVSIGEETFTYTAKTGDDQNAIAFGLSEKIQGSDLNVSVSVAANDAPGVAATAVVMTIDNDDAASGLVITGTAKTASTGGLASLTGIDVSSTSSDADRADALTDIETMINTVIDAQATFGTAEKRVEMQGEFMSKLTDSFTSGIGSLVDADMESASARLQALQVQQQLGTQALSIANQAPQQLLSLFR